MNHLLKYIYEAMMVILVVVTIVTLWTESTFNSMINTVVWLAFLIDFIVRFSYAKHKWQYVKRNPFLVIAIIPFDQFFQIARIVRIFYLFRIKTIVKFYVIPYLGKLTYRAYVLFFTIIFGALLVIAWNILKLEQSIHTFLEAIYVVFGHLLFFGHRIFEIEQITSIVFLTIVSILGVIIQGFALQWFFSKLEGIYRKHFSRRASLTEEKDEISN